MKSLFWAYFFLFTGGFFGLHQIYLGRFRHAFAIMMSLGGYFGIGLIREFWRLPEYVAEKNGSQQYMEKLIKLMSKQPKPSFGISRYFFSIVVADILGYLAIGAIPHEWFGEEEKGKIPSHNWISRCIISIFVPFACAVGVHTVGNIGRCSGTIKWPLIAAYLTLPLYLFDVQSVFLTSLCSLIAFTRYSLKWRRTPLRSDQSSNSFTSCVVLILCIIIYGSLWISWFYFNCTVTDKNEETIKCRVAIKNFFNSPAWLEFRTVVKNLYDFLRTKGFWGLWDEIVEALDPQGEQNALKILGLNETATQDEITSNYRKLARQWHPDKHKGNAKTEAQEKFIAIQEAYDLLSNMKRKRLQKQMT